MPISSGTVFRAAAALGVAAALATSAASAAGPFSAFGGAWKGNGRVSDIHGKSEALNCKSTNTPSSDGIAMSLSLVCASDSYRVDFHSELYTDGEELRGTWTEKTQDGSGDVMGSIRPNVITAITTAPGFSARIIVHVVGGKRLDVTLSAQGTSINHVEVSMKR